MNNSRTYTGWGLAGLALLLSPIILIFSIPLAIGIGFDIFNLYGEAPFALALGAPGVFVLLRQVPLQALEHHLAAALLRSRPSHGRSSGLNYAPKSMS
jgi:hypothetical protein